MFKRTLSLILVCLITLLLPLSGLSQLRLPKKLAKERIRFLEKQISPEDKLFLDGASEILNDLARINQTTLAIAFSINPPGEKQYSRIIKQLSKTTRKELSYLEGKKKPIQRVKAFIDYFLTESLSLDNQLQILLDDYEKCKQIQSYMPDGLKSQMPAGGPYRYYDICLDAYESRYGEDFLSTLEYLCDAYTQLSLLCKNHNIEKAKLQAYQINRRLNDTHLQLLDELTDKMSLANDSWAKYVILLMLDVINRQLVFDKAFIQAIDAKLLSIPTPVEPKLTDFEVASLEFVVPEQIRKGMRITLIATIKNSGDLSADRSRAMIVFPNGTLKAWPIPRLKPGQTYKIKYKYKIKSSGTYTFQAQANYKLLAWEENTANNRTNRSLIIPQLKRR
ncbi:MAG: CARDB domain-containing protein [Candidatus Omnitrophica bacterium]|nr:CARDB domain-containing protein [Candidatus Omnitrophota bacterium]MDD5429243.1 CARDB domain-containing protein [Candidatus Omnitrophota bacterium]